MKERCVLFRLSGACLVIGLILFAPTVSAISIEQQFDCHSNGHSFVAPFFEQGFISKPPLRVESNSINVFPLKAPTSTSTFGFPVYAVLGYQKDDSMFTPGSGAPIGDWAYGVVVIGALEEVEEKVRGIGNTALVHQATPLAVAILCTSNN